MCYPPPTHPDTASADANRRAAYYNYTANDKIEAVIPKSILDAMRLVGWNAFGVYEVVRDAIKEAESDAARAESKRMDAELAAMGGTGS